MTISDDFWDILKGMESGAVDIGSLLVFLAIGLALGAVGMFLALRQRIGALAGQLSAAETERNQARAELQAAHAERERLAVEAAALRVQVQGLQDQLDAMTEERDLARDEARSVREQNEQAQKEAASAASRAQAAEEQAERMQAELEELRREYQALRANHQALEAQMTERERSLQEQIAEFQKIKEKWSQEFAKLAQEALGQNSEMFLKLANENLQKPVQQVGEVVKPVQEQLKKLEEHNRELENRRTEAYAKLQQQVEQLANQNQMLQKEASNLVKALRAPQQRGRWGEIQLRRVVELAGMVNYCDFEEQSTTGEGLRPDMVVHMPNGRKVVVDSKVPLAAYLEAIEAQDEDAKAERLKAHARHVREHIQKLSDKRYWEQVGAVDFVVLFLPSEPILGAALEQDPSLVELGVDRKVLLATPMTLISLLRAVSFGWQSQQLAENAQRIAEAGKELYQRVAKLGEHFSKLGRSLDSAVDHYNATVGTLEARVLPSARKIRELRGDQAKEIEVQPLEHQTRRLSAPEFERSALPESSETEFGSLLELAQLDEDSDEDPETM